MWHHGKTDSTCPVYREKHGALKQSREQVGSINMEAGGVKKQENENQVKKMDYKGEKIMKSKPGVLHLWQ